MLGIGRSGGMEKTSLISLTSEERRTRPYMVDNMAPAVCNPELLRRHVDADADPA